MEGSHYIWKTRKKREEFRILENDSIFVILVNNPGKFRESWKNSPTAYPSFLDWLQHLVWGKAKVFVGKWNNAASSAFTFLNNFNRLEREAVLGIVEKISGQMKLSLWILGTAEKCFKNTLKFAWNFENPSHGFFVLVQLSGNPVHQVTVLSLQMTVRVLKEKSNLSDVPLPALISSIQIC